MVTQTLPIITSFVPDLSCFVVGTLEVSWHRKRQCKQIVITSAFLPQISLTAVFSPVEKCPGHKIDKQNPSTAEVKKAWSHFFTPYDFMYKGSVKSRAFVFVTLSTLWFARKTQIIYNYFFDIIASGQFCASVLAKCLTKRQLLK